MTQGAVKTTGKRSRAVSAKKKAILSAALDTFSQFGFHGTRLEQIAELAGVSKTNLLYYFPSKEALYIAVLRQILDIWLAPLKAFREDFAPLAAIKEYIRLKLEVSRDYPQASRLFCMEMLAGAPLLMDELTGDLKALIDPQHLIFMIWASTQHYADFAPQVEAVTGATLRDEIFFNQTVENVQRIIIEGIRPR
ncbi:HTH-type transcriptional regulator RutR [Escherichia coli]